MLPDRLRVIDETNRAQHYYLREEDQCLYLGEYFAYQGYSVGEVNDLIINFKIPPTALKAKPARQRYKDGAIATIARALRTVVDDQSLQRYTWIPIPPSKTPDHADHDDRILRVLHAALPAETADVRPLLRQAESTAGDHSGPRVAPADLSRILAIDEAMLGSRPLRERIVLFDDVLTTGKHFVCCKQKLRDSGVAVPIIGFFVARRILRDPAADLAMIE